MIGRLQGVPVYINKNITMKILTKMCRSKKKRIRKKWLKNEKNYHIGPSKKIIELRGVGIIIHPIMKPNIMKTIETWEMKMEEEWTMKECER